MTEHEQRNPDVEQELNASEHQRKEFEQLTQRQYGWSDEDFERNGNGYTNRTVDWAFATYKLTIYAEYKRTWKLLDDVASYVQSQMKHESEQTAESLSLVLEFRKRLATRCADESDRIGRPDVRLKLTGGRDTASTSEVRELCEAVEKCDEALSGVDMARLCNGNVFLAVNQVEKYRTELLRKKNHILAKLDGEGNQL